MVVGFRYWHLTDQGLGSSTMFGGWGFGVNTARCRRREFTVLQGVGYCRAFASELLDSCPSLKRDVPDHRAPEPACSCGLYLRYDLGHQTQAWPVVWGAVAAWGRLVFSGAGFRAEHARPIVLLRPSSGDTGKRLEKFYALAGEWEVPIMFNRKELAREARKYGRMATTERPEPETVTKGMSDLKWMVSTSSTADHWMQQSRQWSTQWRPTLKQWWPTP